MIAGLGNPGTRYATTRHNIGWMVCDALISAKKMTWQPGKGEYLQAIIGIRKAKTLVILPTTYMNLSGEAVEAAAKRYKVPPERIIVVADEYNFPVGKIHLKKGGSDGGHNGLSSIIGQLNTDLFWRLRCGIDRRFEPGGMAEYVLSPFAPEDDVQAMITKSCKALELFIGGGNESRALSAINSGKDS